MTPAIEQARAAGIAHTVHEYASRSPASYGMEAAQALGLPGDRVFKTLVVRVERIGLVVAVVPVASELDFKKLARAAGAKRSTMADPHEAERVTGYLVGGISPLGQKKRLPTFVDGSADAHPTIFVSAGRRGLELELSADDLVAACGAQRGNIARRRARAK
jgi:Cys-tRNA(Pro)/Cys-tRNA(Cys) deacylase